MYWRPNMGQHQFFGSSLNTLFKQACAATEWGFRSKSSSGPSSSISEPVSSKRNKFECAPIRDSDQPGHACSLIKFFVGCSLVKSFFRQKTKTLIRLCRCGDWFEALLYTHASLYLMLDTGSFCVFRDFPTLLKPGPEACWIWGKKHLDHQNLEKLILSKRIWLPI